MVIPVWFNGLVMLALLVFAWTKGGTAERVAASTLFGAYHVYGVLHPMLDGSTEQYLQSMILEVAQTPIFFAIALWARRYWTVVVAAVQLLTLATVIVQALTDGNLWAYGTLQRIWLYVAVAAVAYGTWQTWQERRRGAAKP